MSEFNISIPGGQSKRLLTGGKYVPADILVTAEGGGVLPRAEDVNFWDYDGTLLYSYTLEEVQALTELPPLPTHDGLICQGWNWSLEEIRSLTRPMTIGAMYITDDGATRLYISIPEKSRTTIPLYFAQSVPFGVTVDWGDGSTESLDGKNVVNTSHTYTNSGDYVIRLIPSAECEIVLGSNEANISIFGNAADAAVESRYLLNMLTRVEIGIRNSMILPYAFSQCACLRSITIPFGVSTLYDRVFANCRSLDTVILPSGLTSIGGFCFFNNVSLSVVSFPTSLKKIASESEFQSCVTLKRFDVPNQMTNIGWATLRDCIALRGINKSPTTKLDGSCFRYCSALAEATIGDGSSGIGMYLFEGCSSLSDLTIPSSVATISAYAFSNCYAMREYDFSHFKAIPTLENVNAFTNIPADCVIKVPAALYENWIAATNWSVYADHIQGV